MTKVYLGIDVGSVSTNVVVLNEAEEILFTRYSPVSYTHLDVYKRQTQ